MPEAHGLTLDESAHSNDGLSFMGGGAQPVTAFISRRVTANGVNPRRSLKSRNSFFWAQYDALGERRGLSLG